jgi:hypothetical protein
LFGRRLELPQQICGNFEFQEKKTMSKEDEIRDALNAAAQEILNAQSNPRTWLSWVVYLLARLEDQAAKASVASRESYMEMLAALQDEIRNRTRTGGWN